MTTIKGQLVAYVRVSSIDQRVDRQLEQLKEFPVDRCFVEKASGKDMERPELTAALAYCREGDQLICCSMDRLARNLDHLRKIVKELTARKVTVQFLKENLTFTGDDSPMSNLLLSLLGAFSEFERSLTKSRQAEGIFLAKGRGAYKGRKKSLNDAQKSELKALAAAGAKKAALARQFSISRQSVYSYLS